MIWLMSSLDRYNVKSHLRRLGRASDGGLLDRDDLIDISVINFTQNAAFTRAWPGLSWFYSKWSHPIAFHGKSHNGNVGLNWIRNKNFLEIQKCQVKYGQYFNHRKHIVYSLIVTWQEMNNYGGPIPPVQHWHFDYGGVSVLNKMQKHKCIRFSPCIWYENKRKLRNFENFFCSVCYFQSGAILSGSNFGGVLGMGLHEVVRYNHLRTYKLIYLKKWKFKIDVKLALNCLQSVCFDFYKYLCEQISRFRIGDKWEKINLPYMYRSWPDRYILCYCAWMTSGHRLCRLF